MARFPKCCDQIILKPAVYVIFYATLLFPLMAWYHSDLASTAPLGHAELLLINHKHLHLAAVQLQQMLLPVRQIASTAYKFHNLTVNESVPLSDMFSIISASNTQF